MFKKGISVFQHQIDQSAEPSLGVTRPMAYLKYASIRSLKNDSTRGYDQLVKLIPEFVNLQFIEINSSRTEGPFSAVQLIKKQLIPNSIALRLIMSSAGIGEKECEAFRDMLASPSHVHCIESLDISNNSLVTSVAVQHIIDGLAHNTTLKELRMCSERIVRKRAFSSSNITGLAAVLEVNKTLTTLDISGCGIENIGVNALAKSLEMNTALQNLNLTNVIRVSDNSASTGHAIGCMLQTNTCLIRLNLAGCCLQLQDTVLIARALESNSTLQSLNLSGNWVGDEGATALAKALKTKSTLQSLNLAFTFIGDEGAAALAGALKNNKTLQCLDLSINSIGDEGAVALSKALEKNNSTFQFLNLTDNSLGGKGYGALAEAMSSNLTLT